MARIAVTDGMADDAVSLLKQSGHEVVLGTISKGDLAQGALSEFDAIIVRSATKLPAEVIAASGDRLSVIGRAGVGVDNIDIVAAAKAGMSPDAVPYREPYDAQSRMPHWRLSLLPASRPYLDPP